MIERKPNGKFRVLDDYWDNVLYDDIETEAEALRIADELELKRNNLAGSGEIIHPLKE